MRMDNDNFVSVIKKQQQNLWIFASITGIHLNYSNKNIKNHICLKSMFSDMHVPF